MTGTEQHQDVIAPEPNGCYGWPRACTHFDDMECWTTSERRSPAFRRYERRVKRFGLPLYPVAVKPGLARKGWRRRGGR